MTGQTLFVPQIIALSSLPHSSEQTVLAEGSFFYFRRAEELTRITNNSVFSRSVPKEQRALLISVIVLQHRSLRGNRRFKIMFMFLQRASLFMAYFGEKCSFSNTFSANVAFSVVPRMLTALRQTINYRFLTFFHVKSLYGNRRNQCLSVKTIAYAS